MNTAQETVVGDRSVRFPAGQFLVLFLPVAVVILATAFFYVAVRTDAQVTAVIKDERTRLYHISGFVGAEISSSLNHLQSLAEESAVRRALSSTETEDLQALESIFLTLARRNPEYHQVRWIDETGKERVRVMRDQGEVSVVPGPALQDKGERYYFTAANDLEMGELYVSRLDLNVEHGRIETPARPMLRIATPVQDAEDRRRGILVINIAVRYMLQVLRSLPEAAADTNYMLLNQEGYRLGGRQRDRNADQRMEAGTPFAELYPQIWQRIAGSRSGSAELATGLWVWETLSPADTVRSLAQVLPGEAGSAPRLHADELSLTLVAHKPVATLMQTRRYIRVPVVLGALLVLLVYGLSLFFYLRSQVVGRRSELNAAYTSARAANLDRLKELEERFRRLVEASSVGQVVVDAEGRIVMANPAAEEIFGYRQGELIGRSVDDLLPSGLRQRHQRLRSHYLQSPEARRMGEGRELEGVTKDGRRLPVEVGLNPYLDQGKQFVLASVIDLSERKTSAQEMAERQTLQERLAYILDAVPGVVYAWERGPDGHSRLPYANSALHEVFGIEPVVVNQDVEAFFDALHPDDRDRVAATIDAAAQEGHGWNLRFRILHPRKGERWIEARASLSHTREDGGLVWYGYLQDVTEQPYDVAEGACT